MKLGLTIGYAGATLEVPVDLVQQAERLGFDSVWTAEAYGSDAITPLAYLAAKTERIRLGTGIIQVAARTPAGTAMELQTVDALAGGGRVIGGLGVSGPQIVEGWYGVPWGKPYYKLRDYITIMKKIFAREEPVTHQGREISLPYTGPGSAGMAKPLKSILHMNPYLPIWLGSGNPSNLRLTGELCDGILPLGFVPARMDYYLEHLQEGFRRSGTDKAIGNGFEFQPRVAVNVTDDVRGALRAMKPRIALYVGGMGHPELNFHNQQMVRRGYGDAAGRIQELYLAGRKAEALEEVPNEYCDEEALVGPPARIRERVRAWQDSGITGLTLQTRQPEALEVMAEITGASKGARD
ncbi:MAG: LLM class F420-dependent oxidoreductase [Chloroflexi bacterium]|nr:LLM class F420-dependent oxidoreductase [Chloroflexota bacterium]MDA1239332.1 LLM class F420-dependent oxidoreductase [Chloroflexota bacterium]